jgi:UDP-N-acetylmuramyl pentapeptide phosphotransferase/UDP-N-acetylglucosamine-1-phosphate transferase
MSATRILALVLIVVGALMFAYPMISYTTRDKVVDLGPIEVTQEERHSIPVPPILGGIALVAGIALLFAGGRRSA